MAALYFLGRCTVSETSTILLSFFVLVAVRDARPRLVGPMFDPSGPRFNTYDTTAKGLRVRGKNYAGSVGVTELRSGTRNLILPWRAPPLMSQGTLY